MFVSFIYLFSGPGCYSIPVSERCSADAVTGNWPKRGPPRYRECSFKSLRSAKILRSGGSSAQSGQTIGCPKPASSRREQYNRTQSDVVKNYLGPLASLVDARTSVCLGGPRLHLMEKTKAHGSPRRGLLNRAVLCTIDCLGADGFSRKVQEAQACPLCRRSAWRGIIRRRCALKRNSVPCSW